MTIALITGSAGLVGSTAARHFATLGMDVVGIDNDQRRELFGEQASTVTTREALKRTLGKRYTHVELDIRNQAKIEQLLGRYGGNIELIIHAAAQPSHDWSAQDPATDFEINATSTLHLLEAARKHCPSAVFMFMSTNKVYGDQPNRLPLVEQATRWELPREHPLYDGVDEAMPVDQCLHSPFGASKLAADVFVQEYGRYFGLQTVCFRGGCLTGRAHAGAELHGFLAYLVRCTVEERPYTIYGYQGKQVRDNLDSRDLATAFEAVFHDPPEPGAVFNIGGGRENSCSIVEAIESIQEASGRELITTYQEQPRVGDHQWYITNRQRFESRYPRWRMRYALLDLMREMLAV